MTARDSYLDYHFIKLNDYRAGTSPSGTDDPATYPVVIQKCHNIMRAAFQFESFLALRSQPPLLVGADQILGEWLSYQGFAFPGDVARPVSGYVTYLAYVTGKRLSDDTPIRDKDGNLEVFSTALILEKPAASATNPKRWEIWSVAANANYMRSGATKFLMYNIIRSALTYGINGNVYLECDRESFPFITFYDRLMMYYKLGFQVDSRSAASVSLDYSGYESMDLSTIHIRKETGRDIEFELTTSTGTRWYSEAEFRSKVTLLYPIERSGVSKAGKSISLGKTPGEFGTEAAQQIRMKLVLTEPSYLAFINDTLTSMEGPTIPRRLVHIPTELFSGRSYGILYHSGYVANALGNGFVIHNVPPNVEIVIMNSPGFYTYGKIIKAHWNFSQTYLQHFTIEQLKLIFRGIQPEGGVLPVPTTANGGVPYMKAIQQNLLIRFTIPTLFREQNPVIQFHCYSEGDSYPDLEFSTIYGPTSTDWLAPVHGVYDITSRYKQIDHPLDLSRDTSTLNQFATAETFNRTRILGFPDRTKRIYQETYPPSSTSWHFKQTLSNMIPEIAAKHAAAGHTTKLRIFVYSCGPLDETVQDYNPHLINAANNYIGRIFEVTDMNEYTSTVLPTLGETLKTALGRDISTARIGGLGILARSISNNANTRLAALGATGGTGGTGGTGVALGGAGIAPGENFWRLIHGR